MTTFLLRFFTPVALAQATELVYKFPGIRQRVVSGPAQYVNLIFQFGLGIVGLIALGLIVFGGIEYIVYAGNASRLSDAKDRIYSALIGILLLFSSYIILREIDPKLVNLEDPKLKEINPTVEIDFGRINYIKNLVLAAQGNPTATLAAYRTAVEGKDANGNVVANTKQSLADTKEAFSTMRPADALGAYRVADAAAKGGMFIQYALTGSNPAEFFALMSPEEYSNAVYSIPDKLLYQVTDSKGNPILPAGSAANGETVQQYIIDHSPTDKQVGLYNAGDTQGRYQVAKTLSSSLSTFYNGGIDQNKFLNDVVTITAHSDPNESARIVTTIWQQLPTDAAKVAFLKQVLAKDRAYDSTIGAYLSSNVSFNDRPAFDNNLHDARFQ